MSVPGNGENVSKTKEHGLILSGRRQLIRVNYIQYVQQAKCRSVEKQHIKRPQVCFGHVTEWNIVPLQCTIRNLFTMGIIKCSVIYNNIKK